MTDLLPPDRDFLASAVWKLFGVPADRVDELCEALGVTRRELWIAVVWRL